MKATEKERSKRIVRKGVVVAVSGSKTIAVQVERVVAHPLYKKLSRGHTKLLVHDQEEKAKNGDQGEIIESRPYSKRKHWCLLKVLGHGRTEPLHDVGEEGTSGDDKRTD